MVSRLVLRNLQYDLIIVRHSISLMLASLDFDKNVAIFCRNRKMNRMLLTTERDGDKCEVDKGLTTADSRYEDSKKKKARKIFLKMKNP